MTCKQDTRKSSFVHPGATLVKMSRQNATSRFAAEAHSILLSIPLIKFGCTTATLRGPTNSIGSLMSSAMRHLVTQKRTPTVAKSCAASRPHEVGRVQTLDMRSPGLKHKYLPSPKTVMIPTTTGVNIILSCVLPQ